MRLRPSPGWTRLLLVLAGIGLFSCARRMTSRPAATRDGYATPVAIARGKPPKPAMRPAAGPKIDHAKHLSKGLECVDCHMKGAEGEKIVEPRTITYAAACAECHDEEDAKQPEPARVKNVFFRPDGAPAWERSIGRLDAEVKWSHAAHAKKACTECHENYRS